VVASGDGASDDGLADASEANVTAGTTYTLIFIIVAAVLGAVLIGIGLLMVSTRDALSSENQKESLPTIAELNQEDMVRQVMSDYETAYRSLDSSQVGPLASPNQSGINNMSNVYGSPPQINIQSPTSYSPTYSPSPIKLANPPLGAERRAARETRKASQLNDKVPELLDVVSKAQANRSATHTPPDVDYNDLRYDDGEGPYTFDQFVEFYGEDEAPEMWDIAEQAKPGAGAVARASSTLPEELSTPTRRTGSAQANKGPSPHASFSTPKLGVGTLLPPMWLHGRLERDDVGGLLQEEDGSLQDGVFLVRKHARKAPVDPDDKDAPMDDLVLSCNFKGKVTHHRITRTKATVNSKGGFGINGKTYGRYCKSFEELIAIFCHEPLPKGWPLLLTRGVEMDTSSRV